MMTNVDFVRMALFEAVSGEMSVNRFSGHVWWKYDSVNTEVLSDFMENACGFGPEQGFYYSHTTMPDRVDQPTCERGRSMIDAAIKCGAFRKHPDFVNLELHHFYSVKTHESIVTAAECLDSESLRVLLDAMRACGDYAADPLQFGGGFARATAALLQENAWCRDYEARNKAGEVLKMLSEAAPSGFNREGAVSLNCDSLESLRLLLSLTESSVSSSVFVRELLLGSVWKRELSPRDTYLLCLSDSYLSSSPCCDFPVSPASVMLDACYSGDSELYRLASCMVDPGLVSASGTDLGCYDSYFNPYLGTSGLCVAAKCGVEAVKDYVSRAFRYNMPISGPDGQAMLHACMYFRPSYYLDMPTYEEERVDMLKMLLELGVYEHYAAETFLNSLKGAGQNSVHATDVACVLVLEGSALGYQFDAQAAAYRMEEGFQKKVMLAAGGPPEHVMSEAMSELQCATDRLIGPAAKALLDSTVGVDVGVMHVL